MVAGVVVTPDNKRSVTASAVHNDMKEFHNMMAVTAEGVVVSAGVYKATVDPASLADAVGETIQITGCTGVVLGRTGVRTVIPGVDLQDITVTAYVQADGVIEIRLQNEGAATVDLASSTWYFITETVRQGS